MSKLFVTGLCISTAAVALGGWLLATMPMQAAVPNTAPATMDVPANYREWVYLTSGLDMTYTAEAAAALPPNHDGQFDNVFVNPEAYAVFKRRGTWPNQTVFVLENRVAKANVSINNGGRTQAAEVTGLELHVKLKNQWAFYALDAKGKEKLIPATANCYSCHQAHAAVDTTFVQFYPTLLPIAQERQTLSANYLDEQAATAKAK